MIKQAPNEKCCMRRVQVDKKSDVRGLGSVVAVIAFAVLAGRASAALTVYETAAGRAPWASAMGDSLQTITFNEPGLQLYQTISTQFESTLGVTFDTHLVSPTSPWVMGNYPGLPNDHTLGWDNPPVEHPLQGLWMTFNAGQRAISFNRVWWTYIAQAPLHVTLSSQDGSVIGQWNGNWTNHPFSSFDTFIGITSDEPFYAVRLWYTPYQTWTNTRQYVDELSFSTVPAPGVMSLLVAASVGARRRKRGA